MINNGFDELRRHQEALLPAHTPLDHRGRVGLARKRGLEVLMQPGQRAGLPRGGSVIVGEPALAASFEVFDHAAFAPHAADFEDACLGEVEDVELGEVGDDHAAVVVELPALDAVAFRVSDVPGMRRARAVGRAFPFRGGRGGHGWWFFLAESRRRIPRRCRMVRRWLREVSLTIAVA